MKHIITVRMVTPDDAGPGCWSLELDPEIYQATLSAFACGISQIPGIDSANLVKDGPQDQLHIESTMDKTAIQAKLKHAFLVDFSRLRFVGHEVPDNLPPTA